MDGGAWPLLVGELTCHVDSGNERDLHLLISFGIFNFYELLRGTVVTIAARATHSFYDPLDDNVHTIYDRAREAFIFMIL